MNGNINIKSIISEYMKDNINMDSAITESMNANINIASIISEYVKDNIKMDSTITG